MCINDVRSVTNINILMCRSILFFFLVFYVVVCLANLEFSRNIRSSVKFVGDGFVRDD